MIPTWEDSLGEIFLDEDLMRQRTGRKVPFLEEPNVDDPLNMKRLSNIVRVPTRAPAAGDLSSAFPGGDSVPLHRHSTDLPLQQLAG